MVQEVYELQHAVQCTWRCNDGSSDVQSTACSTVQLVEYCWIKWCTDYSTVVQCIWCCIVGLRDVKSTAWSTVWQAVYWLFKWCTDYWNLVQCNWRCIDGSSVVQINARRAARLAVYWWFKWCTNYCMQYSATGGVMNLQVMYNLLHAVQCNWRCNGVSSNLQITVCIIVQLAVYWWFKWCTYYCIKYSASGGVLMVQVIYILLHAV